MFIASSKAFAIRRADGTKFRIPRGFVGDIPEDMAKSLIVKLAIKDGSIVAPKTKKDAAIDKAITESETNNVEIQKAKEIKKAEENTRSTESKKK